MKPLFAFVFLAFLPLAGWAADATQPEQDALIRPAGDSDLSEFLWIKRPIVIFADTEADPRFQQQIEMLRAGAAMLEERDVVVLTDTDPAARAPARQKLRPRGFALVLIDKDGGVKLRKPTPWSVRELTRSIDKMPTREQEIRDRRGLD
ncbi:DUF4174 domain-containing protein [Ruegeria pomeroyi]|nr:DUF4174 domain-containing protein [Ruegeria pomeroyi]NVK97249.1 DUF4174 domain-containing protein [Ruegeria pomeroyi]NVL04147.1 DUF4174 domain-containing protein [Ruegeria pomeroyi]QWV07985.1 DUF4174 domain-containing protein [Ruegeria pomeroyi]HCE71416.1 DUF4174 domain-containing protein [Ruegeria sp.]